MDTGYDSGTPIIGHMHTILAGRVPDTVSMVPDTMPGMRSAGATRLPVRNILPAEGKDVNAVHA